jgi:hypothetical protein
MSKKRKQQTNSSGRGRFERTHGVGGNPGEEGASLERLEATQLRCSRAQSRQSVGEERIRTAGRSPLGRKDPVHYLLRMLDETAEDAPIDSSIKS